MSGSNLKAAVLVISDTASSDPSSDKAGPALTAVFTEERSNNAWETPVVKIVPDNVLDIQRAICQWTDGEDYFNLVVTSGGTGFAIKDNTPEVCGQTVPIIIFRILRNIIHDYLSSLLIPNSFSISLTKRCSYRPCCLSFIAMHPVSCMTFLFFSQL
jgi:gephyrin